MLSSLPLSRVYWLNADRHARARTAMHAELAQSKVTHVRVSAIDAHAKLRKGYSKVLANRLGTKGVEDLHVYFENCHFIKYVKEHKDDDKYLKKCLEQMRSTM